MKKSVQIKKTEVITIFQRIFILSEICYLIICPLKFKKTYPKVIIYYLQINNSITFIFETFNRIDFFRVKYGFDYSIIESHISSTLTTLHTINKVTTNKLG